MKLIAVTLTLFFCIEVITNVTKKGNGKGNGVISPYFCTAFMLKINIEKPHL